MQVTGQVAAMKCSMPGTPFGAPGQKWAQWAQCASLSMHAAEAVSSPVGAGVDVAVAALAAAVDTVVSVAGVATQAPEHTPCEKTALVSTIGLNFR